MFFFTTKIDAQKNLTGTYADTGYFFDPTNPRPIVQEKIIKQISANTYKVELGDLGNFLFKFEVDSNNNLVNWTPAYSTLSLPSNGFMSLDNPSKTNYTVKPLPGEYPYFSSIYNNKYDPVTKTFYLHYGYEENGITDQTGYSSQIYEKLVMIPSVSISSFSPTTGSPGTPITIKGKGFKKVNDSYFGVCFGNQSDYSQVFGYGYIDEYQNSADSFSVISDSVIIAWVGRGSTGKVYVKSPGAGIDSSKETFTFQQLPKTLNSGWEYVGKAGFSDAAINNGITGACGSDNRYFVAYTDSLKMSRVKSFKNNQWVDVGNALSSSKSYNTYIVLDSLNNPLIAYFDSHSLLTDCPLTVKKYDGNNWVPIGIPKQFKSCNLSLDIDNTNAPYLLTRSAKTGGLTLLKYNGAIWEGVGKPDFAYTYDSTDMASLMSFEGDGNFALALDKRTNTPFVAFSSLNNHKLSVMKFDGKEWGYVGNENINRGKIGAFYINISIDGNGIPFVSCQDDNGFERMNIFKFTDGIWNEVGYNYFGKGHTGQNNFVIDRKNNPAVFFSDITYNNLGSVMSYTDSGSWQFTGTRGSIPGSFFRQHSLIVDSSNSLLVFFRDDSQGGRVSVMRHGGTPLPVALLSFEAIASENRIQVQWHTENELNLNNYILEHSENGVHFKPIGALNPTIGNGYKFTDNNPVNGINYYRLQMIDKDGSIRYSKTISVQFTVNSNQLTVFPNPSKDVVIVSGKHIASVQVVDNLGRVIKVVSLKDATNPTISVSSLPVSVYHLRIQTTDGKVSGVGFVKE